MILLGSNSTVFYREYQNNLYDLFNVIRLFKIIRLNYYSK